MELTSSQAQALAQIAQRKAATEKEWKVALTIAGIRPEAVVGGNLDDDPHFMVKVEDAATP